MKITIESIELTNFKNFPSKLFTFKDFNILKGKNGVGKTTGLTGLTWCLWGVDLFNSAMTKLSSPEPTTYDWDIVRAASILCIDEKRIKLERTLDSEGNYQYFVNDQLKKAKEYETIVNDLLDRRLFLSILNPAFFFSLKWDEQRAMMMSYVSPASEKEVLEELPKNQSVVLKVDLKKATLSELEVTHRDNKNKMDKLLVDKKAVLRTLNEQAGSLFEGNVEELTQERDDLKAKISNAQEVNKTVPLLQSQRDRLEKQIRASFEGATELKEKGTKLKSEPEEDSCFHCGQSLPEDLKEKVLTSKEKELQKIRDGYAIILNQYKKMKEELTTIVVPERIDTTGMIQRVYAIDALLKQAEVSKGITDKIAKADNEVTTTHNSFTSSVFMLDAIKAYKAKEAELTVTKLDSLFPSLTVLHYQENKGNGDKTPYFELCSKGKPYRKLSVGEKMKAEIEVSYVLREVSGMSAPILIDNAESYTDDIEENETQVFACYAVKNQELELTYELEKGIA